MAIPRASALAPLAAAISTRGTVGWTLFAVTVALAACAGAPRPRARAEIVPGEVLVHTGDASLLTTEKLSAATGRKDFVVKETQCVARTCRVVVERVGAAADVSWTYALIDALAAARIAGIDGVEPNSIMQPR